jgi:hypothetical protein
MTWETIQLFFKEWSGEIIAILLWSFILFILKLFPNNWRIDKKILYCVKVKKTECEIKVSIKVNNTYDLPKIKEDLKSFWNSNIKDITYPSGSITFYSQYTNSHYTISLVEDSERDESFVTIKKLSVFYMGVLGITKMDSSLEELQSISNIFSKHSKHDLTIITEVTVLPRMHKFFNSNLQGKFEDMDDKKTDKCLCEYTSKNIRVINNGFPKVKKHVKNMFYDWMVHFI